MSIGRNSVGTLWALRGRLRAFALRGVAQALAVVPAFVVLGAHGPAGLGLFAMLVVVGGLSVVFEWGQPQQVQNEISRGAGATAHDLRWFVHDRRIGWHLALNVAVALALWWTSTHWLGAMFPAETASILASKSDAVLAILLLAGIAGATYQGQAIVFGLGHVDLGFAFGLLGTTLSLLLIAVGWATGMSPETMAICAAAAPAFERCAASVYCLVRAGALERHGRLPPPLQEVGAATRSARAVAGMFFYLQVLSLFSNNIDAFYAGRSNSLASVGEYSFLMKLYGIPLLVMSVLNTTMWPRLAVESHAPGDRGRATVRRLLTANLGVAAVFGGIVLAGGELVYTLVTGTRVSLFLLSFLILLSVATMAVRGVLTTFINAAEVVSLNVIGNTVFSFAAIVMKVLGTTYLGVHGLVLANVASYFLFLFPFHFASYARTTREPAATQDEEGAPHPQAALTE